MQIEWTPPEPRRGFLGEWDKFVGPGQTRAEFWLVIIPSVLAGLALTVYARRKGLPWDVWQYLRCRAAGARPDGRRDHQRPAASDESDA